MHAVPRDRWFVGEGLKRRGPVGFEQLIQLLLAEADPRAPLVWHKGFASWTRAEDIPQVERRLTPVLARAAGTAHAVPRAGRTAPMPGETASVASEDGKPGSPLLVYGGLAAGVMALGLVGWLFWPRAQPAVVLSPTPMPTQAPPLPVPAQQATPVPTQSAAPPAPPRPSPGFEDGEAELPPADVRRLRGVAAWSGEKLSLTVENRTHWRVTALQVRVSRLAGDDLQPDKDPVVLLPPGEKVVPGVAELMEQVAPDRKKPGINPFDTGVFEARADPAPEGFHFEIESARGYPPAGRTTRSEAR